MAKLSDTLGHLFRHHWITVTSACAVVTFAVLPSLPESALAKDYQVLLGPIKVPASPPGTNRVESPVPGTGSGLGPVRGKLSLKAAIRRLETRKRSRGKNRAMTSRIRARKADSSNGTAHGNLPLRHPSSGFINGFHVRRVVVNEKKRLVPQGRVSLRHFLVRNEDREDTICPGTTQRNYGGNDGLTDLVLPYGYGYPVDSDNPWKFIYNLENNTTQPLWVFFIVEYRVTTSADTVPVTPFVAHVTDCGSAVFDVPQGSGQYLYPEEGDLTTRLTIGGRLIWLSGHLHNGGDEVRFKVDRECTPFSYNIKAVYEPPAMSNTSGGLDYMTRYVNVPGVPVAAGDLIRIRGVYNMQASSAIRNVMATAGGYVAQTGESTEDTCPPPPPNPPTNGASGDEPATLGTSGQTTAGQLADKLAPLSKITSPQRSPKRGRRILRIWGRATDRAAEGAEVSGVKKVKLNIYRRSGRKCVFLTRRRTVRRSCKKRVRLAALLRPRSRGRTRFTYRLNKSQRNKLGRHRWTILSTATDFAGNIESKHLRRQNRRRLRLAS